MAFKPALNITEQIADYLANLIIAGDLNGGDRIQELKIANQLGVSRGSVREALLILERRHLIEIVPRKGAVVNQVGTEEAQELLDVMSSIEKRWLHVLLGRKDVRVVCADAARAIEVMDTAAKADDREGIMGARADFYLALLKPSNRYVSALFECLLPTSQRVVWQVLEHTDVDLHDIARYYKALWTALIDRDGRRLHELLKGFYKRLERTTSQALSSARVNNQFRNANSTPAKLAWPQAESA